MSVKLQRPLVKRVSGKSISAGVSPSSAPQTLDDRVSISSRDPLDILESQAKLAGKRLTPEPISAPAASSKGSTGISPRSSSDEIREFNQLMRRAADGKIIGWVKEKFYELYTVILTNGDYEQYDVSSMPRWMVDLFNAGVEIRGREFSEDEQECVEKGEYEVAEILTHREGPQYLVRYKGSSMTEAEWLPLDALANCKGLLMSYARERRDGRSISTMRPTQRWLKSQGTGARGGATTSKSARNRHRVSDGSSLAKNPSRFRRQMDALLYGQTCIFDAIDSEYPDTLPKVASKELRTATKDSWPQVTARLQCVLEKYGAGLKVVERINATECAFTLQQLLAPFSSGVLFVLYATQLESHCGLMRNGKVAPYVVNRHTRAKRKTDDEFYIDFQREFRSALAARPARVLAFTLQRSADAANLINL